MSLNDKRQYQKNKRKSKQQKNDTRVVSPEDTNQYKQVFEALNENIPYSLPEPFIEINLTAPASNKKARGKTGHKYIESKGAVFTLTIYKHNIPNDGLLVSTMMHEIAHYIDMLKQYKSQKKVVLGNHGVGYNKAINNIIDCLPMELPKDQYRPYWPTSTGRNDHIKRARFFSRITYKVPALDNTSVMEILPYIE